MELDVGTGAGVIGSRTGFDPFFRDQFERVARAAALVTRDIGAGQELAQEAFIRALDRWGTMESDAHARNFVYAVALNLARSHLRKHARVRTFGLRGPEGVGREDPSDASDDWLEMVAAMSALSPRQRACVVLVDYVDMEPVRVAGILGMSAATVRVHLMRGRRSLRERLDMAPGEDIA